MHLQLCRRGALLLVMFVIALQQVFAAAKEPVNVKSFGATGDGKTDDYNALLKAVAFVNKQGGGTVLFPKGTYYIGKYHTKGDSIPDLLYQNCKDLEIVGENAKIVLNGNFRRTADFKAGRFSFSYNNTIIPFYFKNCTNVRLHGFEVDGGVRSMTRDPQVAERGGFLVDVMECNNVTITNMNLHHGQTDGVVISGRAVPSTNVRMSDVTCSNNARQGMSIGNAVSCIFTNCKFQQTGKTGAYGMHSPGCGVDVEPGKLTNNQVTSDITFRSCVFSDNMGGQLRVTSPQFTKDVHISKCTFTAGSSTSKYQLLTAANGVTIDSSDIDCGTAGSVYPRFGSYFGSKTEIRNSTIKSGANGLMAVSTSDQDYLTVTNNKIICTSDGPIQSYFPYLRMKNMKFNSNQVTLRSSSLKAGKASSMIENGSESTGNQFITDRNNIKPQVSYKGTLRVKE